ncbi:ChbG/HpnK family deacetylase [Alsobacter sp. R-9]
MSRFAPRPTRFALVADDFALTPGVSRAILDLLGRGRLSGTGIMANRPHWPSFAADLRAFDGAADLGLHLNLTLGAPITGRSPVRGGGDTLPAFGALAKAAFTGGLDAAALRDEILAQVDACADGLGRLPDFMDGHQHAHVLPGVRHALLDAVARRWPHDARPWLRDPFDTPGTVLARGVAVPKALVIAALSVGWRRQAANAGCETNRGFAGVSPFDPARDFGADMARFLSVPGPAHLVMCHPGFVDDELGRIDPVVATRPQEHAWLAGDGFPELLAKSRMERVRFAALQGDHP